MYNVQCTIVYNVQCTIVYNVQCTIVYIFFVIRLHGSKRNIKIVQTNIGSPSTYAG